MPPSFVNQCMGGVNGGVADANGLRVAGLGSALPFSGGEGKLRPRANFRTGHRRTLGPRCLGGGPMRLEDGGIGGAAFGIQAL